MLCFFIIMNTSSHHLLCTLCLSLCVGCASWCALWANTPTMPPPLGITTALPLALLTLTLVRLLWRSALPTHRTHLLIAVCGLLLSASRTLPALPPLPPTYIEPTPHTSTFLITSTPDPTPHGWHIHLQDTQTDRTYSASLPHGLLDDSHAPLLPGTRHQIDLMISPSQARQTPASWLHPLTRHAVQGTHAHARILDITMTHQAPSNIQAHLAQQRLHLIHTLRTTLSPDHAALVLAMTLGAKRLLPAHLKEPFAITGTSHLLAISGLHLGTLAALIALFFTRLIAPWLSRHGARRGLRTMLYPVTGLALMLYVMSIGAPISARRALSMFVVLLGAFLVRRRLPARTTLLWAVTMLCMVDPLRTLEPAFWLSVGATGAILQVALRGGLTARKSAAGRLVELFKISAAAWLGTAPIVLALGHELPVYGIPTNMVLVPLVSVIIFPLMVGGVALCMVSPELGAYPLKLGAQALTWCATLCEQVAALPGSVWRPGGLPVGVVIMVMGLITLTLLWSHTRRWRSFTALLTASILITAHSHHVRSRQLGTLRVDFIPVGQGDATLITFPDGATMLVDAGGTHIGRDPGASQVMPWLRWRGITQLDTLVLTHADVDHMRGMFAVVRRATPRQFIARDDPRVPELAQLRAALDAHEVTQPILRPLEHITHQGARVTFYALMQPGLIRNDQSIVIEIEYRGASILLPGDIERDAEALLAPLIRRPVTLIKMPHHGSHTSSTAEFLDHVRPSVAIVSCGLHNRFDHPREEVLERYRERGVQIMRTDHHGLITATILDDGTLTLRHPIPTP